MAINPIQSPPLRGNGPDLANSAKTTPSSVGSRRNPLVNDVDQVLLTPETRRLRQHMDVPEKGPPMNEAKIEALRDAIAKGTYKVNAGQLAGKLFNAEAALFG